MERLFLLSIITAVLLLEQCANINIAGGSSDQGNALVSGIVTDPSGNCAGNASLRLLPQNYTPGIDQFNPDSFAVKTDASGLFRIEKVGSGVYCLSASDASIHYLGLIPAIAVDSHDVINLQVRLQIPGRIKVPIDSTVWNTHDKISLYIPGTAVYKTAYPPTTAVFFDTIFSGTVSLRAYSYTTQTGFILNKDLIGCFVYPGILTNFTVKPFKPRGPKNASINNECKFYTFFEYWKINPNINIDFLEYRFCWGNQDTSAWVTSLAETHQWQQPGNFEIKIQVRYVVSAGNQSLAANNDILTPFYSSWSDSAIIAITSHAIQFPTLNQKKEGCLKEP